MNLRLSFHMSESNKTNIINDRNKPKATPPVWTTIIYAHHKHKFLVEMGSDCKL